MPGQLGHQSHRAQNGFDHQRDLHPVPYRVGVLLLARGEADGGDSRPIQIAAVGGKGPGRNAHGAPQARREYLLRAADQGVGPVQQVARHASGQRRCHAGERAAFYLLIALGVLLAVAAIFAMVWMYLSYRLRREKLNHQYQYRTDVAERLGMASDANLADTRIDAVLRVLLSEYPTALLAADEAVLLQMIENSLSRSGRETGEYCTGS